MYPRVHINENTKEKKGMSYLALHDLNDRKNTSEIKSYIIKKDLSVNQMIEWTVSFTKGSEYNLTTKNCQHYTEKMVANLSSYT